MARQPSCAAKATQFRRKNIRLASQDYIGRRWYFVTACCDERRRLFARSAVAQWIVTKLRDAAAEHSFRVHAYCVMPDHLHLLVEGHRDTSNLLDFVGSFKHSTAQTWRRRFRSRLWQQKFYDHILRSKDSPDSVAWYIWMNPVRRGLCAHPEEHPHSGSFTLDWKRKRPSGDVWTPPWKKKSAGHPRPKTSWSPALHGKLT